jgi:hypothetical protein
MYRQILFAASLTAAAPVQAQTTGLTHWESSGVSPASTISRSGEATAAPSSFRAEFRTDVVTSVSGEAEFGAVGRADSSPAAFVISLGVSSRHGAILFTRNTGTPLEVGRYRVSERADDADEILALVMTGAPDRPTGVYWGRSGWLVITAASGGNVIGHFKVDGVGFLAKEPSREDRSVSVTGLFSAGLASASLRSPKTASDD